MAPKRKQRQDREQAVLLGLIELYLLTRSPIGSDTLRKNGFEHLSSATIRNYFVQLEKQGFLHQQHSSGGRIPTPHAYKFYAMHHFHSDEVSSEVLDVLKKELHWETREVGFYLEQAANVLSRLTQGAVFFSSPRFDQDFITAIQLLAIDHQRYLSAMTTSFGLVRTEILHLPQKLSRFTLNRLETYFRFRLTGLDRPKLCPEEEAIAIQFYNEILLRYIVSYTNFSSKDIYKTGFSKLLNSPEFRDGSVLANGLSLFENTPYMNKILNHCMQAEKLKCWIGDDLDLPQAATLCSSVTAIPYFIHGKPVGAVAVLGPIPSPYPKLFGILRTFSTLLSENLTRNLYKYKVTYRQPSIEQIGQAEQLQLEDQTPPSYQEIFNG